MKYILFLIALFLSACVSDSNNLESLKIYQTKKPSEAFKNDIANKKIHFLATLGFAADIPGVDMINKDICFKNIDIIFIDKTGDSFSFSEGTLDQIFTLKAGARDYASEYNILLKKHLHDKGVSKCKPFENWGEAFNELNAYIWGKPTRHGAGLSMYPGLPPKFTISLLDLSLAQDTTIKACEIFQKNGVSQNVQFDVEEHKKYDGTWKRSEIFNFTCENGTRSELNDKR